jgi:hypothetical protein
LAEYRFFVPYQTAKERVFSGTSALEQSDFSTLSIGSKVEIIYLPSLPDTSMLKLAANTLWADPWRRFYRIVILVLALFLPSIIYMDGYILFILLKERCLARWGKSCAARIIHEKEVSGKSGSNIHVAYEFRTEEGYHFQGTRKYVPIKKQLINPVSAALEAKIRQNPTVLYDARRPSRNLLYPPMMVDFVEIAGGPVNRDSR